MSSTLYLLGHPSADLRGPTLPSNAEMLRYYHHLRGIHTVRYSTRRVVSRCYEIWEKAGLPTSPMCLAIAQMQRLVDEYARMRRKKESKVRRFRKQLRVLFFVGREDAMERCGEKARKLLVASLMMHLGEEEECEVEFEASDDKAKLKLKPEPNNNNNNYIDKKCDYWHDEKQSKMDLEPSDKHRDFWNSIGGNKVRPKIKIEPIVNKNVYNCLADDEKQSKMDPEISDKYRDFWNSIKSDKVRSKTKTQPIVSNNCLADDEIRMKMNLEPIDKNEHREYWNYFDVQTKMECEPSIAYNDDDYAAYLFEEEWNSRYPMHDDGSIVSVKW